MRSIAGRVLGLRRDTRPALLRAPGYFTPTDAALPDHAEVAHDAELEVLDQGRLGSCAAHAAAEALALRARAQGASLALPSRNWIYYIARKRDGSEMYDAGASYASLFQALEGVGFPPESVWPYDGQKTGEDDGDGVPTDSFRRMPDDALRLAYDQRVDGGLSWRALDECAAGFINDVRHAIAIDGYVPCIGVHVSERFVRGDFNPLTVFDPPSAAEIAGGHAMAVVGYYKDTRSGEFVFKVRNSYGSDWGDGGYTYFSERYIRSAEVWLVEQVPVIGLAVVKG